MSGPFRFRFASVARFATALLFTLGAIASAGPVHGEEWSERIVPARPGLPLAHPVTTEEIPPPPFSRVEEGPVDPAYVPGLPGLAQGRIVVDDYGRQRPKYESVIIRQSRVEDGRIVIPAGGLVYLEDTWGGEVALRGEPVPFLGHEPIYIDYDMSIVVKEDVTIPAGQSVVVGGTVYRYYATVGHEQMTNHTLNVRTIAGTDREWAFGAPVLSENETNWWGKRFIQLYNQGVAREVTPERIVFDWISGVRTDRLLFGEDRVFAGWAEAGREWQIGKRTVRLAAVDPEAGTARIEVREGDRVVFERTLGPVMPDRLIEDTAARKALVFEYGDIAGFLVPWPDAIRGDEAQLKIYSGAFSLRYGETYFADPRFAVYPVGCPTGHNFGIMWTNREPMMIEPGGSVTGPEDHFRIVVGTIDGDEVLAWHVEDRQGNASATLGGPGETNIDLVLGQGRVAGQAILKDVGRAALQNTYASLTAAQEGLAPGQRPVPWGLLAGALLFALAAAGLLYELGVRRRRVAST